MWSKLLSSSDARQLKRQLPSAVRPVANLGSWCFQLASSLLLPSTIKQSRPNPSHDTDSYDSRPVTRYHLKILPALELTARLLIQFNFFEERESGYPRFTLPKLNVASAFFPLLGHEICLLVKYLSLGEQNLFNK